MAEENRKLEVKLRIADGALVVDLWDYLEQVLLDVDLAEENVPEGEGAEGFIETKRDLLQNLAYKMLDNMMRDRNFTTSGYYSPRVAELRSLFLADKDAPSLFFQTATYWLNQIHDLERRLRQTENECNWALKVYYDLRRWLQDVKGWRHDDLPREPDRPALDGSYAFINDRQAAEATLVKTRIPTGQRVKFWCPSEHGHWRSDEEETAANQVELDALLAEGWRVISTLKLHSWGDEKFVLLAKEEAKPDLFAQALKTLRNAGYSSLADELQDAANTEQEEQSADRTGC